jgi:hypothetical protein
MDRLPWLFSRWRSQSCEITAGTTKQERSVTGRANACSRRDGSGENDVRTRYSDQRPANSAISLVSDTNKTLCSSSIVGDSSPTGSPLPKEETASPDTSEDTKNHSDHHVDVSTQLQAIRFQLALLICTQHIIIKHIQASTNQKPLNSWRISPSVFQAPEPEAEPEAEPETMSEASLNPKDSRSKTLTPTSSSTSKLGGEGPPGQARFETPTKATTPMPSPGTSSAPCFDGKNATRFLDAFELLGIDHGLRQVDLVVRLLPYCTPEVEREVKLFPEYTLKDWTGLRRAI